MSALIIPPEHASGLARILNLSLEESERIARALESAKSSRPREMLGLVISAMPTVGVKEGREIVDTLRSLYNVRTSMDMTIESFVGDVLKAAERVTGREPDQSSCGENSAQVLHTLLSVRPLSMLAKAHGLHIDHENIFCSARVMSDLRPIFDADVEDDPTGFAMAHVLKLGYHHGGKHADLYVAMDKHDLQVLIDALQRAQRKANTLSNMSQSKGFAILAD